MWKVVLVASSYLVAMTGSAHAYLDPGTGTILVQGLVAAVATGLFFVRSKFRSVWKSISGGKAASNDGDQDRS